MADSSEAGKAVRSVAVLDATSGPVARQARTLAGFLHSGAVGDIAPETVVLCRETDDVERLVAAAPTPDVRVVRLPSCGPSATSGPRATARPGDVPAALSRMARDAGVELFLFAGGAAGTEAATRLACRTAGTVLTDIVSVQPGPTELLCRRSVYSNHLIGRFALSARPWCVSVDAGWYDAPSASVAQHRVRSDVRVRSPGADDDRRAAALEDVEWLETASGEDLAESRFLVVAGRGVGGRDGVERIVAAARRLGADVGATRPVVMNGWAGRERLIGVSGARAAPQLCIVAGASGAPAFFWGIERAGFIAAVDVDDRAAINEEADVVVIDDCVAVVEALAEIVAAERTAD